MKRLIAILASLTAIGLAPIVTWIALRLSYSHDYNGSCGPHAPDIAVHPCSYVEYMHEFGAGFAGVGLLVVCGTAAVAAAVAIGGAWIVWIVVRTIRARARSRAAA